MKEKEPRPQPGSRGLLRNNLHREGRLEEGVPRSALCDFHSGTFLNLYKIAHFAPIVDRWDNRAAMTIPTRINCVIAVLSIKETPTEVGASPLVQAIWRAKH
jgi:hypothetical protein